MQVALKNIVWQDGKYFVAQCLNVEVSSFGETKEEALTNLTEALELYFEDTSLESVLQVENPEIVTTSFNHA
jgi:predicted RNase H-like HicB family nuclease